MSEIAPPEARRSVAGFQEGARGVIPPLNRDRRGSFLSDVITELGFADQATVDEAVEAARQPGRTVGDLLLAGGRLSEEQLAAATAERSGLDYVSLDDFDVDYAAAGLITRSAAQRYAAVPIAFAEDGALIVAMEDPTDGLAISDIEVMTRSDVRRVVASPRGIAGLIDRLPEVSVARVATEPDSEALEPAPPVDAPPVQAPAEVTLNEVPGVEAAVPEVEPLPVAPAPAPEPGPEEPQTEDRGLAAAEQERLRAEVAATAAEQERLHAEVAATATEQERLRGQVAETAAEQERLREQLAEAEAEQERLRAQLAEAGADRDRALEEAANANSGRDLIRTEAMRLAKELKRLEASED